MRDQARRRSWIRIQPDMAQVFIPVVDCDAFRFQRAFPLGVFDLLVILEILRRVVSKLRRPFEHRQRALAPLREQFLKLGHGLRVGGRPLQGNPLDALDAGVWILHGDLRAVTPVALPKPANWTLALVQYFLYFAARC